MFPIFCFILTDRMTNLCWQLALKRLLTSSVALAAVVSGASACTSAVNDATSDAPTAVKSSQTMPEWAQENGPRMSTLGSGISAFTQAAAAQDIPALSSSCAAFQIDVRDVKASALPVPDAQIDGLLRNALELYAKAAASCVDLGYSRRFGDHEI